MRKISANLILPVSSAPLKNGIIKLDERQRIIDLIDTGGSLQEERGLEFYNGVIIPGFVIPWFRLDNMKNHPEEPDLLHLLDYDLRKNGIKGIGLVLKEGNVSDGGFELMAGSPTFYHPVIELCPEPGEDEFEAFSRGIDHVSRAWNKFSLSCSLTACSSVKKNTDLEKYLREYSASHTNLASPTEPGNEIQPGISLKNQFNILELIGKTGPTMNFKNQLSKWTLEAAAAIIEEDDLGSIEPGKQPGLNLVSGLEPDNLKVVGKTTLRVLV